MEKRPTLALIAARSGPLRHSLLSLMNTLSQIDIVAETRDMQSLLPMDFQIKPNLLVMEANLPGGQFQEILRHIDLEWTETRTVVLVDNIAQQHAAKQSGADIVLFKGYRASRLMRIVEDLLSQEFSPQPIRLPEPSISE